MERRNVRTPIVDIPDLQRIDKLDEDLNNDCKVTARVSTYEGRLYVPTDDLIYNKVISLLHDNVDSDHFIAPETAELVLYDFHSHAMDTNAQKYIAGCELCHRIQAPRHAHHSTNMPLLPLSWPGKGDTMDIVTDCPESAASGYLGIFVVIDRLAKMATYLPCGNYIDSPELAWMFP